MEGIVLRGDALRLPGTAFPTVYYVVAFGCSPGRSGLSSRFIPAAERAEAVCDGLAEPAQFCSRCEFRSHCHVSDQGEFPGLYLPVSLRRTSNIFLLPLARLVWAVTGGLEALRARELLLAGIRIV